MGEDLGGVEGGEIRMYYVLLSTFPVSFPGMEAQVPPPDNGVCVWGGGGVKSVVSN